MAKDNENELQSKSMGISREKIRKMMLPIKERRELGNEYCFTHGEAVLIAKATICYGSSSSGTK